MPPSALQDYPCKGYNCPRSLLSLPLAGVAWLEVIHVKLSMLVRDTSAAAAGGGAALLLTTNYHLQQTSSKHYCDFCTPGISENHCGAGHRYDGDYSCNWDT